VIDYDKARKALEALKKRHLTLGAVESLTGGLFSASLCAIPGASKVYYGSLVTYNAKEKANLLGIPPKLIERFGIVSQHVANAMAGEGRKKLGVDVCVSFTGNAGPTAEAGGAPVGRVHMAIATRYGHVEIQKDFALSRNEIREACVETMLDELIAIYEP
jgi:PncC family amidohydrolase